MANNIPCAPGVFRGHARLATQQELADLKAYLESKLTGPIMNLSENGYIPWVLNEDGQLDIDYLFPELIARINEQSGVDITKNGLSFADNVTSIDINGKYIRMSVDENGVLSLTVDEPAVSIPGFNEANKYNSALVKLEEPLVSGMIVPSRDGIQEFIDTFDPYGEWEPGQTVSGINWNGNENVQNITFTTEGPVLVDGKTTYFEIIVSAGGDGNSVLATYTSNKITGNTPAGNPMHNAAGVIYVGIKDFKEENDGKYSFIPRFTINILKAMQYTGGRFRVKIIHHCGNTANSFVSYDYLFNKAVVPVIGNVSVSLLTDTMSAGHSGYKQVSGIKYAVSGNSIVSMHNVNYLNVMAAVEDSQQISYDFNVLEYISDDAVTPQRKSLAYDNVCDFTIELKIKSGVLNLDKYRGWVAARNAFGESLHEPVEVPIIINTQTDLPASDSLHEWFTDESFRTLSNFPLATDGVNEYSYPEKWDSTQSLATYDNGKGLMVVPGRGLMFPYGDWSNFLPNGQPDYSALSNVTRRYFCREFGTSNNGKFKFGGVFKIEGLSKEWFLEDDLLIMLISPNRGDQWYDLRTVRNMVKPNGIANDDGTKMFPVGVMTEVEEKDGALYVEWSYPKPDASPDPERRCVDASPNPVWFKLGFAPSKPYCIKSVTLLNIEGEEAW